MSNVLHISSMWPNKVVLHGGIFVKDLVDNQKRYGENKYFAFIPWKIYRNDFSLKENLTMLRSARPFKGEDIFWGWYPPTIKIGRLRSLSLRTGRLFLFGTLARITERYNISLVHAHVPLIDGFLALHLKKQFNIPYVMHCHSGEDTSYCPNDATLSDTVREVFRNADGVVANSTRTLNLVRKCVGELSGLMRVIPFGVEIAKTPVKPFTDDTKVKVISVGNLIKRKRIHLLLMAISKSKFRDKIKLTIIGGGEERGQLTRLADDLGLRDRVRFLGSLPNTEVRDELTHHDVFVLPSVNEGFGVAYLEALAAGLPAIGVKGEGCEDIAAKRDCMLLVEPNNLEDLTMKIDFLIEHPDSRKRLAAEALLVVEEFYSWPLVVQDYEKLYLSIA